MKHLEQVSSPARLPESHSTTLEDELAERPCPCDLSAEAKDSERTNQYLRHRALLG